MRTVKIATVVISLLCLTTACVAPDAVKAKVGVLESKLEKLTEQHADTQFLADRIEKIENETNQTTQVAETLLEWKKSVQAENVTYGGAGWVVLGAGLIVTLFLAAGLLLLLVFVRRAKTNGNLLKLVTCAVQKTSPAVQERVKRQIEREVTNGGPFKPRDKAALAHFTRENGTFADQKQEPSVQPSRRERVRAHV